MTSQYRRQFVPGMGTIKDPILGITFDFGLTVPTGAGYAPGCIFLDIDAAAGAQFWINEGTLAAASFLAMPSLTILARNNVPSTRVVTAGATLTITQALHDGKTIAMPAVCAITLPAMTGSGSRYRFVNQIAATTVTITATAAHLFGTILMNTDTSVSTLWTAVAATSTGSTIISQNGGSQGGRVGDWIEIEDVATSVGVVRGVLNASGTEATPYS